MYIRTYIRELTQNRLLLHMYVWAQNICMYVPGIIIHIKHYVFSFNDGGWRA